jgi:autotransporter-associated beta strand protein
VNPALRELSIRVAILVACTCAKVAPTQAQPNVVHGSLITLTNTTTAPNGAWSWFEDERAIIDANDPSNVRLVLSSISAGSGSEAGDVDLLWANLNSGQQGEFELANIFEQDDHDSAALYVRPDGRYLAMYSRHNTDPFTRWRISTNPHDPTSWGPEQTLNNGAGATYDNIYYLPADNGGAGRTYNFTRADGFDPVAQTSADNGSTWIEAGRLLIEGTSSDRPYLRYASDGKRIDFITTDRHPANFPNSIYHGYIQDGKLYNSSGTVIDSNLFDANAVAPAALTPVFKNGSQFGNTTMNRAWTINMEMDNTGNPVGIFTARANDSDQDHRFFYARYDGADWHVNEMARAGGFLYVSQEDYTGLASIDPDNPNVVYMSSKINPATNITTSKYELYRGVTANFGETWTWAPITENSTIDNLRPVVPKWNGASTAITWMRGTYTSYTNWNTEIVATVQADTGTKSLLWRGNSPNPTSWDVGTSANWDSGGGSITAYNNGDEVAFDDSAATFQVNLPATMTPAGVAFNNATHNYTVTGAGISGSGMLRVIGGGNVTLANGTNLYTGETRVADGTLTVAGGTTLSGTPHIRVSQNGTFDVTASAGNAYTLTSKSLTVDGKVMGNIDATSTTVIGGGKITGNLVAHTGTVIQVGSESMSVSEQFTYLDATHGVGGNTTLSTGANFTPTTNPDWQIRGTGNGSEGPLGNGGRVYQGGSDNPASAPELRTTITGLNPGQSYSVYVNYWDATGSPWRILAGTTPGNLNLFDSPLDNIAGATNGIDPNTLHYATSPLTAEGNRQLWGAPLGNLVADANGQIKLYVNDTGTVDGDDRTWYDGVSYRSGVAYSGLAVLTVDGGFTMDAGSILKMEIGDTSSHDQLDVSGAAVFHGTLSVALVPRASIPLLGQSFDLLNFASASGAFDSLDLPSLSAGLSWYADNLLTTGVLKVVLTGDYNADGSVDAADYVVWRKTNINGLNGYNAWRANFGHQAGAGTDAGMQSVPEPGGLLFVLWSNSLLAFFSRRRMPASLQTRFSVTCLQRNKYDQAKIRFLRLRKNVSNYLRCTLCIR